MLILPGDEASSFVYMTNKISLTAAYVMGGDVDSRKCVKCGQCARKGIFIRNFFFYLR